MDLRLDLTTPRQTADALSEAQHPATPPARLAELLGDARLAIRRAAAANPAAPRDLLRQLERLGCTPDLAAFAEPDPTLPTQTLRGLAVAGPWPRTLIARHPATPADLLADLAADGSTDIRAAVAAHAAADAATLAQLVTDAAQSVRTAAAEHPRVPADLLATLRAAGGDPAYDLPGEAGSIAPEALRDLAGRGPWARRLAARHPATPADLLHRLAQDADWRVRAAIADNPAADADLLRPLADLDDEHVHLALADHPAAPPEVLARLASDMRLNVRLRVAGNPNAPADALAQLTHDGIHVVRQAAAANPATPADAVRLLVEAGATADLAGFVTPRAGLAADMLATLAVGGPFAQELAARHPATPAEVLAPLACDDNPLLRERIAAHPNRPADLIALLVRAGSDGDLQGYCDPDATVTLAELESLTRLGPWPRRLVARHPAASPGLLNDLAQDPTWQVRREVARHPATPDPALTRLAVDPVADVRWTLVRRRRLPADARLALSRDEHEAIRDAAQGID